MKLPTREDAIKERDRAYTEAQAAGEIAAMRQADYDRAQVLGNRSAEELALLQAFASQAQRAQMFWSGQAARWQGYASAPAMKGHGEVISPEGWNRG